MMSALAWLAMNQIGSLSKYPSPCPRPAVSEQSTHRKNLDLMEQDNSQVNCKVGMGRLEQKEWSLLALSRLVKVGPSEACLW